MNRSIEQRATKTPAAAACPLIEPLEQRQLYTAVQFGTPTPLLSGGATVFDVATGDFNHDGKQDVAAIRSTSGVKSLALFAGDGTGKLGAPVIVPTNNEVVVLAAGDFNGDGRDDLAAAGSGITAYLNNGSGLVAGTYTPVVGGVHAITGVYFDNDNCQDIAVATFPTGIEVYMLGGVSGNEPVAYQTLPVPRYVSSLAAGNFNQDKAQDLVVTTQPFNGSVLPGQVEMFYGDVQVNGNPVGKFIAGPTYAAGSLPRQIVVTDLNGDQRDDVILPNEGDSYYSAAGSVQAMLNNGAGGLGSPNVEYMNHPRRLAVANFGGGKIDYVQADLAAGLRLSSGNGNGTFGPPTSLNAALSPTGVWKTDLNGDGKIDLIAADNAGKIYTILNTTQPGGSIAGNVFNDIDSDAFRDSIEGLVPNWTVYLDADNDKVLDAGEKSTKTDSDGNYLFAGLAAGTYKVRQLLAPNWMQTTPASGYGHSVTLSTNQSVSGKTFGTRLTGGSITGSLFDDINGDGVWNGNELGVFGRTVYLDADNDKVLDAGERWTTTGGSGVYAFTGLATGTYKVRQVLPAGWTQTTPASGVGIGVTISGNQAVSGKLFGSRQITPASAGISGKVFNDLDGDGVKDAGEVGIGGRTVWLDLDNDKVIDGNEATTLTDVNGNYAFAGLAAGTYKVRQVLPAGWKQTTPANGYGINVTLTNGQMTTGKLFGAKLI